MYWILNKIYTNPYYILNDKKLIKSFSLLYVSVPCIFINKQEYDYIEQNP